MNTIKGLKQIWIKNKLNPVDNGKMRKMIVKLQKIININ